MLYCVHTVSHRWIARRRRDTSSCASDRRQCGPTPGLPKPSGTTRLAKAFVAANATDFRLIQLPGDCPELNPDELLNQDVKTNARGKSRPHIRLEMIAAVRRHLFRCQKQPQVIKNLLQERHVRHAA